MTTTTSPPPRPHLAPNGQNNPTKTDNLQSVDDLAQLAPSPTGGEVVAAAENHLAPQFAPKGQNDMPQHTNPQPNQHTPGDLVNVALDRASGSLRVAANGRGRKEPMVWLGGDAFAHGQLAGLVGPVGEVTPHPENPRRGNIGVITESIRMNGLYRPAYVQRSTGFILTGNHMTRALVELGAELVPRIWLDVDDETAARILLADNRASDMGSYENDALLGVLSSLAAGQSGLSGTGYDDEALAIVLKIAEAEGAFTSDWEGMADEFRDVSGMDAVSYHTVYARRTVVFIRDDDAIEDFKTRLGVEEELGAILNYPLGWVPDDRRKTHPEDEGHEL